MLQDGEIDHSQPAGIHSDSWHTIVHKKTRLGKRRYWHICKYRR